LLLTLGTDTAALLVAASLLAGGTAVEGWHRATQLTARFSAFVFLSAFLAGPLARISTSATTRALVRERRRIGLGFAGAHFVHLAALLTYFAKGGIRPPIFVPILGGFGYVLIALMAITSNDWAVRALGRNWKRLHTFGIYYIWLIFELTYLGRLMDPQRHAPIYYVMTGLFLVALAVRLTSRRTGHARMQNLESRAEKLRAV
jgi:DMSO/TMAO reductase YedYZ heme-binding membrane subunit